MENFKETGELQRTTQETMAGMPVLMQRKDWEKTILSASHARRIWHERVDGGFGEIRVSLPESGSFEVVFIEIPGGRKNEPAQIGIPGTSDVPSIRDFIGYGRKFHPEYRSTKEVMRELREGESDDMDC